jgi:dienelactone hydrolase
LVLDLPDFHDPQDLPNWIHLRQGIRQTLWNLLGTEPSQVPAITESTSGHDGYTLEKITFPAPAGPISGYLFLPEGSGPHPAILYCHWHGGQYGVGKEEMLGTNATPLPPGPTLARLGYAVFGIDAPGFGERNGHHGRHPQGGAGELNAAKLMFWQGQTLWGQTLSDDLLALGYLATRPEVDASRIGVTGISMGSTRAWWLMALDDRPKAASCVACMTRYQDLIDAKALAAHGIYYFVPRILKHFDTEVIIGAAAPRALLFQTGDQDVGSPIAGVMKIGDAVSQVYQGLGQSEKFRSIVYPGVGHVYTPEMWDRTLEWFAEHL